MTLFWIATVVAVVISAAFVSECVREFRHLQDGGALEVPGEVQSEGDVRFSLKALGGVAASFTCIVLLSVTPYAWYLMPILSLGSAVAVTAAFLADRRAREKKAAA